MGPLKWLIIVLTLVSGCVENDYVLAPDKEESVELPAFVPDVMITALHTSEVQFQNAISFATLHRGDVCNDITTMVSGDAVALVSTTCEKSVTLSGEAFYEFKVTFFTKNTGEGRITVYPRSNPKGGSSFRVIVIGGGKG
jgi:hypothetical protein